MPKGGSSAAARIAAAERRRQVVALRIRGLPYQTIGKQLGISKNAAYKHFKSALKEIPKADREELRKLEAERIADLRQRLWGDLAGKPDPNDQNKMIRPEGETLATLVNAAIRLSRHEAMISGLDAPTKSEVLASMVGGTLDYEKLGEQWDRLTQEEQDHLMRLLAKLQGRWVEPQPSSIETTAMPVTKKGKS
jgi:transposase